MLPGNPMQKKMKRTDRRTKPIAITPFDYVSGNNTVHCRVASCSRTSCSVLYIYLFFAKLLGWRKIRWEVLKNKLCFEIMNINTCANSKNSSQPALPSRLIKVYMRLIKRESWTVHVDRENSVQFAHAQTDLRLHCSNKPLGISFS